MSLPSAFVDGTYMNLSCIAGMEWRSLDHLQSKVDVTADGCRHSQHEETAN